MAKIERPPKKILVMRLSALGDVAMTVPVLSAVTQQYPETKITILTRAFYKPLFSQIPNVDVYTAEVNGDHKGFIGLWKLFKTLKKLRLEAGVDLHDVLRTNILKEYFRMAAIPFYQIDKGRAEKKALTKGNGKEFRPLITTHERYAMVFKEIGLPLDLSKVTLISRQSLSKPTLKLVGSHALKWIGVAPFAAYEGKWYPLSKIEEVIVGLERQENLKIILFGGGKNETEQLDEIAERHSNCLNIAGKLSFTEELALISNLDLMLSMDSGNGHLAAMYGVPVVTIWGVTHPYAGFYPFRQDADYALMADRDRFPQIPTSVYGNKMPKGYEKAIASIPPETVVAKVLEILDS